jgi:hypothetical protein
VLYHATTIDRTPVANDYEFARTILGMALLMPRAAPCVSIATTKPMALDELFVALGNPVRPRSMGVLNEATLAWTMRAPDYQVGTATFHWVEFEDGIGVLRTDSPTVGTWPSGSEVVCPLPSAGTGKKWQMPGPSYTNPTTGFTFRNHSPTICDGTDVTSVSLRSYIFRLIRRVDA